MTSPLGAGESRDDLRAALADAWGRQAVWSSVATTAKRGIERMQDLALVLLVVAAVAGGLGAQLGWFSEGWQRVWGLVAALAIAVAGGIHTIYLTAARSGRWTAARQASESLKSLVYASLAVEEAMTGSAGDVRRRVGEIEHRAGLLSRRPSTVPERDLPAVAGALDYLEVRVRGQQAYHDEAGAAYERRAERVRAVMMGLGVAGAGIATASGWDGETSLSAWIAALASASAALSSYGAAGRFDHLASAYFTTSSALERTASAFLAGDQDASATDQLVATTERILGAQNQTWLDLLAS